MTNYILDSSAWIHYFLGDVNGEKVKKIVEDEKNECFTSTLTISEIIIKLKKFNVDYEKAFERILALSKTLVLDERLAFEAGVLYAKKRSNIPDIGIVDVIIQTHAREGNYIIITSDEKHFKDEKNIILI
ncbi:PIN domain-containing protein [Candidatus Micrarchaeota archaeon]|nr:PIN domain-containing protein [Candidatus Micrarchaeota archaeon]